MRESEEATGCPMVKVLQSVCDDKATGAEIWRRRDALLREIHLPLVFGEKFWAPGRTPLVAF